MGFSLKNLSFKELEEKKLPRFLYMYVGLCKLQIVDGSQYWSMSKLLCAGVVTA